MQLRIETWRQTCVDVFGSCRCRRACSSGGRSRWRTGAAPSRRPTSRQAVDAAYAKFRTLKEGKNADYIPALAKVDPNLFGIALVTVDGKVYTAGDVQDRGLDPVDLQGLHDGPGHPGAGAGMRSRNASAWTPPAHGSTRSSRSRPSRPSPGRARRR